MAHESTYIAMRVHDMGGALQPDHVRLETLGEDEVRVEIMASGICYADLYTLRRANKNVAEPKVHYGLPSTP